MRNNLLKLFGGVALTTIIVLPILQTVSYIYTKVQINKAELSGPYAKQYCEGILKNSSKLDKFVFGFDEAATEYLYKSK